MLKARTVLPDGEQAMVDFSEGRVSRHKAMRKLDVDYSELLDMLRQRNLPVPELSDDEAASGARKTVAFLNTIGK